MTLTRRTPVMLAALLTLTLTIGCVTPGPAVVSTDPTAVQVQQDRQRAVQAATAITAGLLVTTQALDTADSLEQQGIIQAPLLRQLLAAHKVLTTTARTSLDVIEGVAAGKDVNLSNSIDVVIEKFADFLAPLEKSNNDRLRDLAVATRAVLTIITARGDL